MTIPARTLRSYVHPSACYEFLDRSGRLHMLDFAEICRYISSRTIEGVASKGGKIKFLRETKPQDPIDTADTPGSQRQRSGGLPAALQTVYEENIGGHALTVLMRYDPASRTFKRWGKEDQFSPRRWNPDRVPESLASLARR